MDDMQPWFIVLIIAAFFAGCGLGWLVRGERSERADAVRQQRLQTQLDASHDLTEKLQRQRDELQRRSDDALSRHHQHQRQLRAYREGLDELAARNRRLEQRITRAGEQLKDSHAERDRLDRQLRLMIRRTRDARQASPVAAAGGTTVQRAPVQGAAAAGLPVDGTKAAVAPPRSPAASDELQRVRGIGPALARKLRERGIDRLQQIANLDDHGIDALDRELAFPGRIRRDRWVEQARALLAAGDGGES